MRVGWREYLKQRFRKPSKFFSVGIELGVNDVHVSVLQKRNGKLEWQNRAHFPVSNWQDALKTFVADANLDNTPCHITFSIAKYQLLQIDRPQVEDAELSKALTWAVKDLIPSDQELVLDYVDLPAQSSGANKINVVAIPANEIQSICQTLNQANLLIASIGVAELAICDLLEDSEEAVLTLVQQSGHEMCLNIVKHGKLYFSRRLKGYENLATFNLQELQMGVGDNLSVEIQRSMDYFESQLRQAPVKRILLGVETDIIEPFAELMQQLTYMPVEPFIPQALYTNEADYMGQFLPSLGAAMSQMSKGAES